MSRTESDAMRYNVIDAQDLFERTAAIDMSGSKMMHEFLTRLPARARVLDAGCGSGRDAAHFASLGHEVCAFDAHPDLVRLAHAHMGVAAMRLTFAEVEFDSAFDGVWACASLLHLPPDQLPDALARLARALVPGGIITVSFKQGQSPRYDPAGRYFNDLDETGVQAALDATDDLTTVTTFTAPDAGGRAQDWTIGIARRALATPNA